MKNKKLEQIKTLSILLDSKFTGPFGIKFGLDALLGFIPGIGDFVTMVLSIYIVIQAGFLGCSASTLIRMGLNILFENLIDLIPVFGNFFDFYWKSNDKNVALLEAHLASPKTTTIHSRLVLLFVVIILLLTLIFAFLISFWTLQAIYIILTHGV